MVTADPSGTRHQTLTAAIAAELQRQADSGTLPDAAALATAVEQALEPALPDDEGKRPDELNATNDD